MEKRKLGRTDLEIAPLSFGAMKIPRLSLKEAGDLLGTALDKGINLVDTAPEYGNSEELIGKTISHRRSEFFIATKCGDLLTGNGPNPISPGILFSKKVFTDNIEKSLKLLKTDTIDLMQMHGMMPEYLPGGEQDELIILLLDLIKQGKIRYIGCTYRSGRRDDPLYPAEYAFNCFKTFMDWQVIDTIQAPYGIMTRQNEIAIQHSADKGTGLFVRGVMKQYSEEHGSRYEAAGISELYGEGESKHDFMVRFALSHPGVCSMVIGTTNRSHLSGNVNAVNAGPLPGEIYAEAKKRLNATGNVPSEL